MSAMEALSKFLSSVYSMSLVFFTLLLLELLALVRSVTGSKPKFDRRVITTAQYMKLIERTSPTTRFADGDPSPAPECRVCLAEFEGGEKVRRLQCGHAFHRDCLDTWLQMHQATCPLCRTKVLPDDVVESYRRMRDQVEFDGHDEELIFFLSALHGNSFHRLYF